MALSLLNRAVVLFVFDCLPLVGLVLLATNLSAQSKEEIYDMYRLEVGAHEGSSRALSNYWLRFGKDQIGNLKYGEGTQMVAAELETVLEPLILAEQALGAALGTDAEAELERRFLELLYSDALAQKVFDVLGPEYCLKEVVQSMSGRILQFAETKRQNWWQLFSELNDDRLAKILALTDDQKKKIELHTDKRSKLFKQKVFEIFDELSLVSDRRWQRLLSELDASQRMIAKQLIGSPVEWFRELNNVGIRSELANRIGGTGAYRSALEISNVERLKEFSLEKLEAFGLDVFDSLEWAMFRNKSIQNELELVEKQKTELLDLRLRLEEKAFYFPHNERFQAMLDGNTITNPLIRKVFLPKQVTIFNQIEFQIRLHDQFDSTAGLLDPRMINHLSISKDQRKSLDEIGDEYFAEMQQLLKKIPELQQQCRSDLDESLADILEDSQHEIFPKYTGRKLSK